MNQQIGRILQQNQRAAARFAVRLEDGGAEAGFRLAVEVRPSFEAWAALSEGAYLLRSNIVDWREDQLWKAYIQPTQAEAAFRIKKDQLRVRPVWHQRADRVEAHILVCFLPGNRIWSSAATLAGFRVSDEMDSTGSRMIRGVGECLGSLYRMLGRFGRPAHWQCGAARLS